MVGVTHDLQSAKILQKLDERIYIAFHKTPYPYKLLNYFFPQRSMTKINIPNTK